ncbi:ankyrin repeat domain-containing protein [Elongatibacter sediminis]|uniref:Ankyrin repeat domain-containing protein n=1 Tax=Elongatibacter sediminis TaxID=3119006 RepID=A0AAW9RG80_9GAMM
MKHLSVLILLGSLLACSVQEAPDLFALISASDVAGLEAALQSGVDPDQRQSEGLEATPLMWATGMDDPQLVALLIEAGATVDARDNLGDPAINWAAYYGNLPAIELLLAAGADTHLTGHGNAVEIVMRRGHQDALHVLLAHRGELPDRSAAEVALADALDGGNVAALDALVDEVDLPAMRDFAGRPVIQVAARAGATPAIEWLAARGYGIDTADAIGFTALFEAAREGHAETVSALIDAGADIHRAARPNGLSLTPLHLAAIGDHADVMSVLLAAGADTDVTGTIGATPLMWAVFEGSQAAARMLLEVGADAGLASSDGSTFITIAEQRGWDKLVDLARDSLKE